MQCMHACYAVCAHLSVLQEEVHDHEQQQEWHQCQLRQPNCYKSCAESSRIGQELPPDSELQVFVSVHIQSVSNSRKKVMVSSSAAAALHTSKQ
jgi:hypothetical protein